MNCNGLRAQSRLYDGLHIVSCLKHVFPRGFVKEQSQVSRAFITQKHRFYRSLAYFLLGRMLNPDTNIVSVSENLPVSRKIPQGNVIFLYIELFTRAGIIEQLFVI